jgi:aminoglycoside phosphotransferase (APT) family kinase protein/ribosomal protein S18 acetylase RimI-like enzyme
VIKIIEIDPSSVKDKVIDFNYVSDGYYDVVSNDKEMGFTLKYVLHPTKINKHFSDHVVSDYIEHPIVYFVYDEENHEVGYLTLGIDEWNQRLRIWNILINESYRHLGIGTLLINKAKELMKLYNLRQIVLETQSCNNKAIAFYLKNGFKLIGIDTHCYSNYDIKNKEVRLEFGYTVIDELVKKCEEVILNEIQTHPLATELDILKLIYQSEFGPGHFIKSKEAAYNYLEEECKDLKLNDKELFEEVSDNLVRVNLSTYLAKYGDIKKLSEIFYLSSLYIKGDRNLFLLKIEAFKRMIKMKQLNFSVSIVDELINELKQNDYAPFSHSRIYKENYDPHYRIIKKSIFDMMFLNVDTISDFNLPFSKEIELVNHLNKGWSYDIKYYLKTKDNQEYLLRLSDITNYKFKKEEYEILNKVYNLGIKTSTPIAFGVSNNGEIVFSLLSWIKGEEALEVITNYSEEQQYQFGLKAGEYLRKIHSITYEKRTNENYELFMEKTKKRVENYKNSPVKHSFDLSDYVLKNAKLVKNTPKVLLHGDYHLGNMIIDENNDLCIIDFNRFDKGDPISEFNRLGTFSALTSPSFAKGQIDGYFNKRKVPLIFWKRLALYTAANCNFSLLWSLKYSQAEVEADLIRSKELYESFNEFKSPIPKWHK